LQFNGDDAIGLFKNNNLIDIIGAGNSSSINVSGLSNTNASGSNPKDTLGHTIDLDCWITDKADNINGFSNVIGTNLCLLIRKSTVHSGDTAIKYNTTDFITLPIEWIGVPVIKHDSSTCKNFDYVGSFDYGNYYGSFTQIYETDLSTPGVLTSDSSYTFVFDLSKYNLDSLPCTDLKFTLKYSDNTEKEETYKVPIFIKSDSIVSGSGYPILSKSVCDSCDVVILSGSSLNVNTDDTLKNRNVIVYPGARLIVPQNKKYKINSLTLRRENNIVPYLLNNGKIILSNDSNYFFELRTDATDWRWMTLPTNHKVSNIKENNGKLIKLGSEVFIRHYNGQVRAINHKNGWEDVNYDSIFSAGQGFLFGVDLNGDKMKTYKFKFPNDSVNIESSSKRIHGLRAWGCNDNNLAPNHKGWNLIGNPFTDNDTTDIITPISIGKLVKDTLSGQWNGHWILDNESVKRNLRYAVIPITWRKWSADEAAAGGYASELLDDYILLPFTAFFVQIGGNEDDIQGLAFKPIGANPINRIVAHQQTIDEDEELFLRVKVGERKTGMFISNKFTDEYEPGDDLESRYPIYQSIGGYKLLYSAINDSIIEHGVQVTAPQGTLYLDPKVDVNKFEYIYANYNNNWYDLKSETVEVNGNFIIQAKRKIKDTPTDIEMLMKINNIEKFIYNNNMYIKKHDHIYNVLGNQIR